MGNKCIICGKPAKYNKRFCTEECFKEHDRRIKRASYFRCKDAEATERICPTCGKIFVSAHATKKYCSEECRFTAHNKKACKERKSTGTVKICERCGAEFIYSLQHRKYCSDECKKDSKRERESAPSFKYGQKKKVKRQTLTAKKIQTLHDQGMSYAEYQMLKTKAMIPPVRTVL